MRTEATHHARRSSYRSATASSFFVELGQSAPDREARPEQPRDQPYDEGGKQYVVHALGHPPVMSAGRREDDTFGGSCPGRGAGTRAVVPRVAHP